MRVDPRSKWIRTVDTVRRRNGEELPEIKWLEGYATTERSGLDQAMDAHAQTFATRPENYLPGYVIFFDLSYILIFITENEKVPEEHQLDLLRSYAKAVEITRLDELNDLEVWALLRDLGTGSLMGLSLVADLQHRDRFELRDMYLAFAGVLCRNGGDDRKLADKIRDAALTLDERGDVSGQHIDSDALAGYRQLLETSIACSREDLQIAYHRQIQLWHPDKLQDMAPELKLAATSRMAQINEAYTVLRSRLSLGDDAAL